MDAIINNLELISNIFNPLNLIGSVFIFILNGLVLYVLFKKLKFDSIELKFIFLLCIIELIIGVIYFSLSVFKFYYGYSFFAPNNIPCITYAFLASFLVRFEFVLVAVLALWRYLIVVHEIQISMKLLVIYTIVGFLPTASIYIYGLTNINMEARPGASYIMCTLLTNPSSTSMILNIISTTFLLLPCWIITYCYFVIGWKANKKLNLMASEAETDNNEVALKSIKSQKIRLIIQLIVVFILYNVDIMVSVVTYFMRLTTGYKRPPFFDAVVFEMGLSVMVFNPIVTVSFQPEVNNEIVFTFVKLHARIKKFFKNMTTGQ